MLCFMLWGLLGMVFSCRPAPPDVLPLPTSICVRTLHHGLAVKNVTVYAKFGVDSFPGYDKPASYYDDVFKTGKDARGCLESVPEGKIWLVAFGKDSIYTPPPYDVRGSVLVTISIDKKPKLDTTLFVSEKH